MLLNGLALTSAAALTVVAAYEWTGLPRHWRMRVWNSALAIALWLTWLHGKFTIGVLSAILQHIRNLAAACVIGTCLAACGQTVNEVTVFADPGEYEWYPCEQLLPMRKGLEDKERDLKLLIDKDKQSTGGAAISMLAYPSDYVSVREQIKVLDATARVKKCKIPPSDSPQATSAAR
jgi:hypothetical protein